MAAEDAVAYDILCPSVLRPGDDYIAISIRRSEGSSIRTLALREANEEWGLTLQLYGLAHASVEYEDSQINVTDCSIGGSSQLSIRAYIGSSSVALKTLRGVSDGLRGATGPMCYIAGEYSDDIEYKSDTSQTVAVEVPVSGSNTSELWQLNAATNWEWSNGEVTRKFKPNDGSGVWSKALSAYNTIRTRYLFAEFAKLGSAVVTGDWIISTSGMYGTVEKTEADLIQGKPVYMRFDPSFPDTSVNQSHTVNGSTWNGYNFVPHLAADLRTGEVYMNKAHLKGQFTSLDGRIVIEKTGNWYGMAATDADGRDLATFGLRSDMYGKVLTARRDNNGDLLGTAELSGNNLYFRNSAGGITYYVALDSDQPSAKLPSTEIDGNVMLPGTLITGSGAKILPASPKKGQVAFVKGTSGDITSLDGNGKDIMFSDGTSTGTKRQNLGKNAVIYIYDGIRWLEFWCG